MKLKSVCSLLMSISMLCAGANATATVVRNGSDGMQWVKIASEEDTVSITEPSRVGRCQSQEEVDRVVEREGYISGTLNADGTVTYVMTESKHNANMQFLTDQFDQTINEDIIGSSKYPKFVSMSHNDDFTKYRIEYSGDEITFADEEILMGLHRMGDFYAVFNGSAFDGVHVEYVNSETGNLIREFNIK